MFLLNPLQKVIRWILIIILLILAMISTLFSPTGSFFYLLTALIVSPFAVSILSFKLVIILATIVFVTATTFSGKDLINSIQQHKESRHMSGKQQSTKSFQSPNVNDYDSKKYDWHNKDYFDKKRHDDDDD